MAETLRYVAERNGVEDVGCVRARPVLPEIDGARGRIFEDAGALSLGRAERLVPPYIERYHRWGGVTAEGRTHVLDQALPYLTTENRAYLDDHLHKSGLRAVLCTEVAGDAVHLGVALFDEEQSPRCPVRARRVGARLERLVRPDVPAEPRRHRRVRGQPDPGAHPRGHGHRPPERQAPRQAAHPQARPGPRDPPHARQRRLQHRRDRRPVQCQQAHRVRLPAAHD
jgi:hypothetical protein